MNRVELCASLTKISVNEMTAILAEANPIDIQAKIVDYCTRHGPCCVNKKSFIRFDTDCMDEVSGGVAHDINK